MQGEQGGERMAMSKEGKEYKKKRKRNVWKMRENSKSNSNDENNNYNNIFHQNDVISHFVQYTLKKCSGKQIVKNFQLIESMNNENENVNVNRNKNNDKNRNKNKSTNEDDEIKIKNKTN